MTIKEIKDRIYQGFITSFDNAITPLRASFFDQISNILSSAFHLLYIYFDNIYKDSFLSTCTESRVTDYFAPLKNLELRSPTVSAGIIRFYGVNGSTVPSSTITTYNELEYITLESGIISDGYLDLNCESVSTGTITNTLSNINLTLNIPISGIENTCISILGFSGAIDTETIESLRTRTKQKFATSTKIDNDNFYKSLANEISNVKASFVSSLKNGNGTFGITILTNTITGIPTQEDLDSVQEYFIENNAIPVYVEAEFFIPTVINQNFSILLADNSTANQKIIKQTIADYLYLYQKADTAFQFSGLSDYLQTMGARLNSPDPTSDLFLNKDEVLDIGTMTWI